jgi:hypothetical protein
MRRHLLLGVFGEEKEATIASAGEVVTAFVSGVDQRLFIVRDDIRWDLDPEEYEVLPEQEQPQTPASEPATDQPAPVVDGDFWRATTIEQLGLSEGICKILREDNSINTLGDIADWTGSHSDFSNPLLELKKVGQAKATMIEKAMEDYWKSIRSN